MTYKNSLDRGCYDLIEEKEVEIEWKQWLLFGTLVGLIIVSFIYKLLD